MSDVENAAARLQDLESRLAHQEQALHDLSETTRAQWDEIDTLKRQVVRLQDRIAELEQGGGGLGDERPPHY